ncbi:YfiT family bacillithiol transferase [Spirosoma rigui]|uniref:YfiT family bacillithiol transferase n=1 Tax=Spirosoma rigui TaxID=564064 RepID=UPI0009B0E791|nr:putative metal-dependent hydrolase [Spirosoma rigui]
MISNSSVDARQYPIGSWDNRDTYSSDERAELIAELRNLPTLYRQATEALTDEQLARCYRPGSWTVRQLVHHIADTQHWHFYRVKQTLSEPEKTIGIFGNVNAWAAMPEARQAPVNPSLLLIDGIHQRWAFLCETLSEADWKRVYYHPFRQRDLTLEQALAIGVWHGRHHLAHIGLALEETAP